MLQASCLTKNFWQKHFAVKFVYLCLSVYAFLEKQTNYKTLITTGRQGCEVGSPVIRLRLRAIAIIRLRLRTDSDLQLY